MNMTSDDDGMSPGDAFPPLAGLSAADEAAARWVARLTSGETTPEERAAFARWRAADPAHEAALAGMRELWLDVERGLPVREPQRPAAMPAPSRRRRLRAWALAASVLLGTALGFQYMTHWRHDARTAAGERRELVLADGSHVWLRGDTALDLHASDARRGVRLARGEAVFEVVADAARPFVVEAGDGAVHVLGTRFAVRHERDATRVIVERGRVALHAGAAAAVVLGAEQHAWLRGGAWSMPEAADSARELAWRGGRLIVADTPLDAIADELAAHYRGRLFIADRTLRARRFSAVINLDRIDDWIDGLAETESLQVTRLGPLTLVH